MRNCPPVSSFVARNWLMCGADIERKSEKEVRKYFTRLEEEVR